MTIYANEINYQKIIEWRAKLEVAAAALQAEVGAVWAIGNSLSDILSELRNIQPQTAEQNTNTANIIATPAMITAMTPEPRDIRCLNSIVGGKLAAEPEQEPERKTPDTGETAAPKPVPEKTTTAASTTPSLKAANRGFEWTEEECDAIRDAQTGAEAIRIYRKAYPDNSERTGAAIINRWVCLRNGRQHPQNQKHTAEENVSNRYPAGAEITVVRCGSLHKGKVGAVQKTNGTQVLVRFPAAGDVWIDAKDIRRLDK